MAAAGGDAAAGHIQLKVKDQQGSEVQFKIKKSTPLRKITEAYCSRWGLGPWQVRLMVAFNGHWLDSDDTAEKVGLVDGDIIAAFIENVHDSDLIGACIKHWPALQ